MGPLLYHIKEVMFYTLDTENCRPLQNSNRQKADTRTNRIQQFIEMLEKNEKPHPLIGLNLFSKRARATDLGLPRV